MAKKKAIKKTQPKKYEQPLKLKQGSFNDVLKAAGKRDKNAQDN